jgi:hypothetical protein
MMMFIHISPKKTKRGKGRKYMFIPHPAMLIPRMLRTDEEQKQLEQLGYIMMGIYLFFLVSIIVLFVFIFTHIEY